MLQKTRKNSMGYIDSKGIEQIPAQFSSAESFSKERHAVVRSAKSGLFQVIDTKGDTLWTDECDAPILDDRPLALKDKNGVARRRRNIFIEPRFEDSESFGNPDLAPVKIRGKWLYKLQRRMENKAAIFQSISVFRWLGRGTNRNSIRA